MVVSQNPEKGKIPLSYEDNDQKLSAENQRLMWSLVRIRKEMKHKIINYTYYGVNRKSSQRVGIISNNKFV